MEKIKSILIANRGEIAVRVIKTCNKLNIHTVAVYSTFDKNSLHVKLAKEAHPIGGSEPLHSYLNIDAILEVCRKAEVEAVHPGYGFLSENAEFAEKVIRAGFIFIGPKPEVIRLMGSKSLSKELMIKEGIPVVPGYNGENQDPAFLLEQAEAIGFPVLIKASAGGGGKGMKLVSNSKEFFSQLELAKQEAFSFFKDSKVLLEKYIDSPRHIEFQIFGDAYGKVVHLFERDCSIQRRHQKIIEESPADISENMRERMGKVAIQAAKSIGYTGAGTIEFIVPSNSSTDFFFLEMNTRLQVEHPVTEMVTGLDLVELQIKISEQERLEELLPPLLKTKGHSIEARIYAEDPDNSFMPSTGTVVSLIYPQGEGIRIDSGIEEGSEVSIYYDPMIAKLIVRDIDRQKCISRLLNALNHFVIFGIYTNIDYLKKIITNNEFVKARVNTHFLEENISVGTFDDAKLREVYLVLGLAFLLSFREKKNSSTWSEIKSLSFCDIPCASKKQSTYTINSGYLHRKKIFEYKGNRYTVQFKEFLYLENYEKHKLKIEHNHKTITVILPTIKHHAENTIILDPDFVVHYSRYGEESYFHYFEATYHLIHHPDFEGFSFDQDLSYKSPMPGKLVQISVLEGQSIKQGETLMVIEAMKMRNEIKAHTDSVVSKIFVQVDQLVALDQLLLQTEKV
jgi:3-methylcrotonyl-CoA carboxylase alpha subunit